MSKRWLEQDKKRRANDAKKPKRKYASRCDAAIAVATRWMLEGKGFLDGDASGDMIVDDIGYDVAPGGEYVVRVPIRVGKLDVDEEMQKLEGE